ncbi:formyltransferase family protein [Bacillus pseudomycoides]|uniref:phosphoribosylglycinamide formyltransferase 1 n=1 Tax=Bacillus pseudomycoides TaxID=64104 RepID=A0A2B5HCC6_9BACI|nr:formyltransferase family protein [Bacillus pseudomycoides]PDY48773.1 formyl transferase [Bacillus pseudomycoides]PEA81323.1 formyl transferase [Bacillus pseudomycoides]PED06386.1 formyl transferase [Bacillus pseudomycoides]PED72658.1 formyl transferase [Bacillus pseudomycoides]PEI39842.1 formyl transferase [Bacillus pseudomycoides]
MNILLLGSKCNNLYSFLKSSGNSVVFYENRIDIHSPILINIDFIVSYGYRYMIPPSIIEKFNNKIINLHISYLPWNKGADPNLWSFLEDTPKGVTIHYVNNGLDTGDIITQSEVPYKENDTLKTSYDRLCQEIERLFIENWKFIYSGKVMRKPQPSGGSYHRLKDKKIYLHLLTNGWNTSVKDIIGIAKMNG